MDCTLPPKDWYCTRNAPHDGPCAALPGEPTTCHDCGHAVYNHFDKGCHSPDCRCKKLPADPEGLPVVLNQDIYAPVNVLRAAIAELKAAAAAEKKAIREALESDYYKNSRRVLQLEQENMVLKRQLKEQGEILKREAEARKTFEAKLTVIRGAL